MPNATQSEEARAQQLQEELERNREVARQQHPKSESSVEQHALEPRQEELPCGDCGKPVVCTVLYRAKPKETSPGEYVWVRGWLPPVVCADCAANDIVDRPLGLTTPSLEDWLLSLGVNTRKHGRASIENFDPTDAPRAPAAAREFVAEVVASGRHDRVRGLYLVSDSKGSGKTHLAVAIMRAVHEQRLDMSVVFDPADRLITKIQDSYGSGQTDELVEVRRNAGLYVLDDLGREKDSVDALRTICTILDEREGAPTVITSNHPPHGLSARAKDFELWSRVASRLGDEVYRYVAVDGRDRRFAA